MSTDRIEIHADPYGDGSRGYPVRDLHAAIRLVRLRREPGQRAVIWLAGGEYRQRTRLDLTGADSFTSFVAADPDAPPVITGSERVTGWRSVQLGGRSLLAAPAPSASGRCLYVNGRRADRPRHPRDGYRWIEHVAGLDPAGDFVGTLFDGSDRFRFAAGDVPELADPGRVEVVVPHYWVQERMPITELDHDRRMIISSLRSIFALRDDAAKRFARYYLDNVAEALGEVPGEWYLDHDGRLTGADGPQLLYCPRADETGTGIEARMPVLEAFVRLAGTATAPVREVRFEGVGLVEADFAEVPPATPPFGVREDPVLPPDGRFAADVQAASTVPAALQFEHARSCAVLDCRIERVGGYGISLGPGSRGNLVSGSVLRDLGAGAVRSGGALAAGSADVNQDNEISDNVIEHGGRSYPSCVAVLFQHGAYNVIAHNAISDFRYTGISVGWVWDYKPSPSVGNLIEGNHLHDLGQGLLNDLGGIYLLGIAPGTVVRGNHIHDVHCANYGGWGIYLDEGSSHVVVEGNVVHDVSSQAYHHHYGRESIIRGNVFAFGGQGQLSITRPEPHVSFTFERNVVVGQRSPAFVGSAGDKSVQRYRIVSDLNLYWDFDPIDGAVRAADGARRLDESGVMGFAVTEPLDRAWRDAGHDRHSVDADPGFVDVAGRDLRIRPGSPAEELGITVPDLRRAGPRPVEQRLHPLAVRTRP